jgi:hypothetical protein
VNTAVRCASQRQIISRLSELPSASQEGLPGGVTGSLYGRNRGIPLEAWMRIMGSGNRFQPFRIRINRDHYTIMISLSLLDQNLRFIILSGCDSPICYSPGAHLVRRSESIGEKAILPSRRVRIPYSKQICALRCYRKPRPVKHRIWRLRWFVIFGNTFVTNHVTQATAKWIHGKVHILTYTLRSWESALK